MSCAARPTGRSELNRNEDGIHGTYHLFSQYQMIQYSCAYNHSFLTVITNEQSKQGWPLLLHFMLKELCSKYLMQFIASKEITVPS